ncbi:hypothetical protein G647_09647 [Cladophialophora carrionii CBS 160.54]|uniref:Ribosomal protein S21 n=1 Tax=Cladophialophora carrionii CBS 160.54 TaxID=1279043 RepID=V9DNC3_9EURO|nr:uncharacterized protein G647_09647 [Cladophialophora carrionii CBS 160.54]ETI27457.1 hypothetical protein G647_09647 [Cladophialophora carrionii CBS 160.54]
MNASRTLQRCTRHTQAPQLYNSSNNPVSSTLNAGRQQPRLQQPHSRSFSATSCTSQNSNPYRKPNPSPNTSANTASTSPSPSKRPPTANKPLNNDFMQSLIRETRAREPTRTQSQGAPSGGGLNDILRIARTSAPPAHPRSPTATHNPTTTVNSVLNSLGDELASPAGRQISLRLRPTLGRTVDGLHGDPTRGFRMLERKCAENNVKGDMRSQEKHIRRGQRRKNVRILRWRKLFLQGFKAELATIHRMRRQGW